MMRERRENINRREGDIYSFLEFRRFSKFFLCSCHDRVIEVLSRAGRSFENMQYLNIGKAETMPELRHK